VNFGIERKTALVAAATRGIGLAVAQSLLREGCKVSICGRTEESVAKAHGDLVAEFEANRVRAFRCDIRNREELREWVSLTRETFGRIEILVTNTGGPPAGHLNEISEEQWLAGFESTVMNIVRLTELTISDMIEGGWGRIVHLTSIVAFQPNDLLPISTTLRAGLRGMTRLQSNLYAKHGITVNAVLPGHTLTERQKHIAQVWSGKTGLPVEKYFEQMASEIPIGRLAQPSEIGDVVAFLCSTQASYITGVSLLVDGGASQVI